MSLLAFAGLPQTPSGHQSSRYICKGASNAIVHYAVMPASAREAIEWLTAWPRPFERRCLTAFPLDLRRRRRQAISEGSKSLLALPLCLCW